MCRLLYRQSNQPTTPEDEAKFKEALYLMEKGGPDEQGYAAGTCLASDRRGHITPSHYQAGHNRLSIQNLKGGKQPKVNDQGVLLYNGELYDPGYVAIRYNLAIQETGDTEILFRKLQKDISIGRYSVNNIYQEEAAYLYKDLVSGIVFLYRGNMGIKPIYYYQSDDELIVSSEIKSIIALTGKLSLREESVQDILIMGYTPENATIYEGIYKVMPNQCIEFDREGHFYQEREFEHNLQTNFPTSTTYSSTILNHKSLVLNEAIRNSVKKRITNSDTPVSLTLSGGVDSAIIAYLATEYSKEIPVTYTLSFKGFPNEIDKARRVTEFLGIDSKHQIIEVDFDKFFEEDLDDFISAMDEPMDKGSMLPTYYLAKHIKEKVTLVGEGADELFGGYNRHEKAFLDNNQPHDQFNAYYSITKEVLDNTIRGSVLRSMLHTRGSQGEVKDLLAFDQRYEVPEYHAMRLDKMMMHFGKEVRLPYLDVGVVRVANTIKNHIIVNEDNEVVRKAYLRDTFKNELPDWFLSPPKEALKIPYNDIVEHPVVKDLLMDRGTRILIGNISGVDIDISRLYADPDIRNRGRLLWLLFLLVKWTQKNA